MRIPLSHFSVSVRRYPCWAVCARLLRKSRIHVSLVLIEVRGQLHATLRTDVHVDGGGNVAIRLERQSDRKQTEHEGQTWCLNRSNMRLFASENIIDASSVDPTLRVMTSRVHNWAD